MQNNNENDKLIILQKEINNEIAKSISNINFGIINFGIIKNKKQIAEEVIKESGINTTNIYNEGKKIIEANESMTKKELANNILKNIANNPKKYKFISKIAKEMIIEGWNNKVD